MLSLVDTATSAPVTINSMEYIVVTPGPEALKHDPSWSCIVDTVRPGDQVAYDRERNRPFERAELISRDAFPFGKPATVSYYQYIAPGSGANLPVIIGQMHNSAEPTEMALQPVIAMQINGGVQRIITRSVAERFATQMPAPMIRWSAPVTVGRWVQWTWEITPDPVKGHLRVWRDGVSIIDADMPLGFNDPRGPYWQFGIYRVADSTVMRVAYADVIVRLGPTSGPVSPPSPPTCAVAPLG